MNDARIARARLEGNVKGQRWLEAVHTLADRVRRRAARGVGECAESQSHSSITTHQHANGRTKQKLYTSHTSHPLHYHARDVRHIPRSQTRIRVGTPRVNPGSEPVQPPRQTGVWTVADTQIQHIHTSTSPAIHRQSFHFDTEDTGPAYIHTRPETYQVPGTGTYATI